MAATDIRKLVEAFVRELVTVAQTRSIYGKDHALTREAIGRLTDRLTAVLNEQEECTIGVIGNEIAFEREPFYELSKSLDGFIASLAEMKIEKVSFMRGVDRSEIASFLTIFSSGARALEGAGGLDALAEQEGIRHIVFGKIGFSAKKEEGGLPDDPHLQARQQFDDGVQFLRKTIDDITNNRPIDIGAARFFVNKIIANLLRNRYSLLMLTSIKSHDEYTFIHSINVAIFTVVQGEALGLAETYLTDLGIAGLLHDSGKVALSGDILRKPTRLDDEDFEKVKQHPVDGARILLQGADANVLAALAAFEHHMRYDLSGYPPRLGASAPSLISMMVAIADVYDALRSKRAYHEDMAPEKTHEEMMKLAGTHFHPLLLENFFSAIGIYPPGTLVELDDHAVGIVVKENMLDMRRPYVEVLYDSAGSKVGEPYIINLLEKGPGGGAFRRTIRRSIIPSERFAIPEKYAGTEMA